MDQPRERLDSDTRRQQLEHAVIALVSEHGFRAVTTDAVTKKAGVSKGLLWRYYANLDELMLRAVERTLTELEKIVAQGLDLTLPVPELFRETVQRASQLPKHHRVELLAIQRIANNLQSPNGNQTIHVANGYKELYANQITIIKRGQAEGSINPNLDAQFLARAYQGSIDTMIDQLMHDQTLDPELYAKNLVKMLLNGIAA